MATPTVDAPDGWIWAWNEKEAHLVPMRSDYVKGVPLRETRCSRWIRATTTTPQLGYSTPLPCPECLARLL